MKDGKGSMPQIRVTRIVKHVLTSTYNSDFYPGMTLDEAVKWETEQPLDEILEYILDGTSEMVSATAEIIEDTDTEDTEHSDTENSGSEAVTDEVV